jgi:hypothetical protein
MHIVPCSSYISPVFSSDPQIFADNAVVDSAFDEMDRTRARARPVLKTFPLRSVPSRTDNANGTTNGNDIVLRVRGHALEDIVLQQ